MTRRGHAVTASVVLMAAMLPTVFCRVSLAAPVIEAPYSSNYTLVTLGSVPGLPANYGGLTLEAGNPDVLLVGGSANNGAGAIYAITVTRDLSGHITGFTGSATLFATAPDIDGGLAYGPGGVLFYTGFPNNTIGEILPGHTSPSLITTVTANGVTSSVGTLQFVPAGAPGAGDFKVASYSSGAFYNVPLTPNGDGTYAIGTATGESTPGGGPEGIAYVPAGSANFASPSLLLSEYGANVVDAYQLDGSGNPVVGTATPFITGLAGAEGAFVDPVTGDYLFSTFGSGNQIIEVQGFQAPSITPEPASFTAAAIAVLGGVVCAWRRRSRSSMSV